MFRLQDMVRPLETTLNSACSILFPSFCLVCARPLFTKLLCSSCSPEIDRNTWPYRCQSCFSESNSLDKNGICHLCQEIALPFEHQRFLWPYEGKAKEFIQCLKYRPSKALCKLAGKWLEANIFNLFGKTTWDILAPLPSSPDSLRQRNFNQCSLIGENLIRENHKRKTVTIGVLDVWALQHRGIKAPQASLQPEKRINNVKSSFKAVKSRVQGKSILLLDDVTTTGATVASAATALLSAGASRVDVLALARSETWHEYRHQIFKKITSRAITLKTATAVLGSQFNEDYWRTI